jgi:hypothetical protein
MNSDCQKFLEDPETHAAHLQTCERCRAMVEHLETRVAGAQTIRVDALPLAPWEGAGHKSWPLVIGVILGVIAIAAGLFAMAGLSPVSALADSIRSRVPSAGVLGSLIRLAPGAIQNAPAGLQIAIVISFIIVNAVLFLLLRRSPRGIDA